MTSTPLVPGADAGPSEALRLHSVVKTYGSGANRVSALRGVNLTIAKGSFTAIMGPSGSGKSTLLHSAAGLDRPSSGTVHLGGTEISGLKSKKLTAFRRDHVGFVFQAYNLLPALNVEDNITLPLRLGGRALDGSWLDFLLDAVGLAEFRHRRPSELSGGQQQRVAIARALITRPHVVFGDEPTGALDSRAGTQVLDLLAHTARELDQTVVVVTHDPVVASHADRVIFLADGAFAGHLDGADPARINERMSALGEW
ncbi:MULTISPECIES: ABC transporter ATP-binding protein [unclassified Microbacterium]|uniref:ABC transporter ATP-binding protein n=1 Tax=unclassified Microbacterium TaxID=2609290 RepID=UPI001605272C|nr:MULTISPECIES: ABC transporter ATP-binding protein [unclassified Microbacterium]QNA91352.1 ABC transporter ATP-binding protein [Microbacterium sp. Se63.02b]QYM64514.1 ABC transporter ATP-binding protein [Microbacterium sp. Se5.02b]